MFVSSSGTWELTEPTVGVYRGIPTAIAGINMYRLLRLRR